MTTITTNGLIKFAKKPTAMESPVTEYLGLTDAEVQDRRIKYGYNELPSSEKRSPLKTALGVVTEPMFLLLVACGTLYLLLGDHVEGIMLLSFVFVIMGIEYYQENKTEKALDALKDLASPRALVIRQGVAQRIAGREVVKDDIIVLREGDRVPADGHVLNCVNLMADESLLTGEPVPVRKREWAEGDTSFFPGGDELPLVFSGSMIVQGNGFVRVTAVGKETEIGKIGKALESVEGDKGRLGVEISLLVKRLAISGIVLCSAVIFIYFFTRGDLLKGFLAGLTLAMAVLPEEFPVVLTVFMAIGAWRISKRSVLTRKPSAIETLGSATVLCTDKTGTLTKNKMEVSALYNGKQMLSICKDCEFPEEYHSIIEFGILSSQANPFDPMERAILNIGQSYLEGTEHFHGDWQMEREYPLSKELLAMSRAFSNPQTGSKVIAAKGAPEAIFDLCHLSADEISKHVEFVGQMAGKGLRVLGVAKAVISEQDLPNIQHDFDFEFIGLIGLEDPVREEVPLAVKECHNAGIRVIMITGDYPVTAMNIAREIGLNNPDKCITGSELAVMSEEELGERIKEINVFARVVPEQKLKIVNALKSNGETVAMTGDGVNDAPALKSAHIGIAMGEKGTDVARESSALVLLDDNFASIVGAIRMGRRIFDNLQKALGYIFAIHVPIAGLSLIPVLTAHLPLILWPVHIVFLELIIDPACSIIFEAEKEEKNVMTRPPRNSGEKFFGIRKIIISSLQGVSVMIMTLIVYFTGLNIGFSEDGVRTLSFITLITSNIAIILSNRSWSENIFTILKTPNKTVKWVAGGAIIFLTLILTIPFLRDLFQFEQIGILPIFISIIMGLLSITGFEIYKAVRKNS